MPVGRRIYLDHNATTPLLPEAREAMMRAASDGWGNPSSHHWAGRVARGLLDSGRAELARALGAEVAEIVFCSGASEADNLALRGICAGEPKGPVQVAPGHAPQAPRDTLVITAVEHPAVQGAAEECARRGWQLAVIPVDGQGRLDLGRLDQVLAEGRTLLVSAMAVNNETGVVFPVKEIASRARAAGAFFHCDAVQALGKIPVDVKRWGVDLASFTAHKAGGPKGIGALFVRKGLAVTPLIVGGSQERDRRAGTENVAGIVAFAQAVRRAVAGQAEYAATLRPLRDRLERELLRRVPGAVAYGAEAERVANTSYVSFPGTLGENLLLALDLEGIAVSGGSACASGALHPSTTLQAMGVPDAEAMGSVRFSLGVGSTDADVDAVLEVLPGLVERQRLVSQEAHSR